MKRYSFLLLICLIAFFLGFAKVARGESTESVEKRAHMLHFATAYGLSLTGYMLLKRAGMPTFPATLLSLLLVNTAGAIKEMTDDHGVDKRSLLYNGLGSGAALGTALLFSF